MKNISIVHIEDEFEEFDSLVGSVAVWIEDYHEEVSGDLLAAKILQLKKCPDVPASWIVYEITVPGANNQKIRYIFIRDKVIPKAVAEYFFKESLFIVDVLRVENGNTELTNTVAESLVSVYEYAPDKSKVALFTAHQGNGIESAEADLPRKIAKESDTELIEFIGAAILQCLADD